MSQGIQAACWMIATGFLAVSITTLARFLSDDFHAFQLVFFYSLLASLLYIPLIVKGNLTLKTPAIKLHSVRAVLEFAAFSLIFYTVQFMPLPAHTSLSFTSPLFASIWAIYFLKERNSLHRWIALAIGFVGVLVIARPGVNAFDAYAFLVVAAAMCFSLCGILIKKLTFTEPSSRIAFYMLFLTTLVSLPFAIYVWNTPTLEHLPYLGILGIMAAIVQYTVSKAFSKADVTTIVPFFFLNLFWSSAYAYLVFDEIIDEYTIMGVFIIIFAAVYAVKNAHNIKKATNLAAAESNVTV